MIVPMKQAVLLVTEKEKGEALLRLRRLGVLHLKPVRLPHAEDLEALRQKITQAERALVVMGSVKPLPPEKPLPRGAEALNRLLAALEERDRLVIQREERREVRRWFDTWGRVRLADVEALEAAGIRIRCYRVDRGLLKKIPEGTLYQIFGEEKGLSYVVLFALRPEDRLEAKEEVMPRVDIEALDAEIASLSDQIDRLNREIAALAGIREEIVAVLRRLKQEAVFRAALEGMGREEGFVYLRGFLPEDRVDALKRLADSEGWGYLITDPEDPSEVPTLLRNPKLPRLVEPLFKFMGTLPGYHEVDVSFVFLLFFSFFYAMIIGDAGYGFVFLGATALLRSKMKKAPGEPFALFYVLSVTTIVWGAMTGSWFGSRTLAQWPLLRRFIIDPQFSFNESREATLFMMRFSFILGLLHLAVAHFVAFLKRLPSIRAVAQLGWILICVGMFFVVDFLVLSRPFPRYAGWLLIGGIGVVGVFSNFTRHPLKLVGRFLGTVAGSIQNVIGAFSDIVSYIRLFAVGLAGVTVAATFNDMAGGVAAPIVLVLGHGLNIVLGMMSVMVHGIRLNMLEFSGHLGQEWTGFPYEPFKEEEEHANSHPVSMEG